MKIIKERNSGGGGGGAPDPPPVNQYKKGIQIKNDK